MKATDLMIGDWVFQFGKVAQIVGIRIDNYNNSPYFKTNLHDTWYESGVDGIEPIPLTQEILEKNRFVRQDGDEYYKEVYSYQKRKTEELEQGDVEYYIDLRRHPIHGRFEFEEGFVIGGTDDNDEPYGKCTFECNFIYDIRYVHQLQHALKQHETDKEIVL